MGVAYSSRFDWKSEYFIIILLLHDYLKSSVRSKEDLKKELFGNITKPNALEIFVGNTTEIEKRNCQKTIAYNISSL